jgi:antitoxin HigA-1
MALRLGRLFGNSPEFWLNAQRAVDLWDAQSNHRDEMKRIRPMKAA